MRSLRMAFYAVAKGRQIGIFQSWNECEAQVKGFPCAAFKKFKTKPEAQDFIDKKLKISEKLNLPTNVTEASKAQTSSDDEKRPRKRKNVDFAAKAGTSKAKLDEVEEMFLNLEEVSDEVNSSTSTETVKRKDALAIKFDPPGPTTEKLYNAMNFQQDAKGFVHVYTDGSCINNGKYTAAAGFGVYFGEDHPLNVSEPITGRPTNNAGEIQASIRAIQDAQSSGIKRLNIFTDSHFLINSVCKWMSGWKRNGWKVGTGKSVVNQKDFKRLDELIESGDTVIKWSYIPAHKGFPGNEEADRLAKLGASRYQTKKEREEENLSDLEYF